MIIKIIIIFVMAIMNFAAGFAAFIGSERRYRLTAFWFLLGACASAIWGSSIAVFMNLGPNQADIAPFVVACIYVSPFPLIIGLAGYNSWGNRRARPFIILACIIAAFFASILITRPELLYSNINLYADAPNTVTLIGAFDPLYLAYEGFMLGVTTIGLVCIILDLWRKKKQGRRLTSELIFFGGFMITMTMAMIFDMVLSPWNYTLIWIGPIATAAASIGVFYRIVKQTINPANSGWIVSFGYLIVVTCAAVLYLALFHAIFTALFNGNEPSFQVLVLNLIMFIIVMFFAPVLREIFASITSTVTVDKINMPHIVRKLGQYAAHPGSYNDLAELLTANLHFYYVGLLIDGKLYNPYSSSIELTPAEIEAIAKIPLSHEVIQHPSARTQMILNKHDIVSVASLGTNRQILIGKPIVKRSFSKREVGQVQTTFNLVAAIL